jgi:hypothetical protein
MTTTTNGRACLLNHCGRSALPTRRST